MKREHKITVGYKEIFQKGTITLLITFCAGALFGRENMMIAFVLALGSSNLAKQNLKVKTFYKACRLIFIDSLIVCIAYIASLNVWFAIPINFITIFLIMYLNVSLHNQTAYKTFMMLYVFCQYGAIPLVELPSRIAMVIFSVTIMVSTIFLEQNNIKLLLSPQIGTAFGLIGKQLILMKQGGWDQRISEEVSSQMNDLATVIYGSSFKRYFTTFIGKVNFKFYLTISYLNFVLIEIGTQGMNQLFTNKEIEDSVCLFEGIQSYFRRYIVRAELINALSIYLSKHPKQEGIKAELWESIFSLSECFQELDEIPHHKKHQVYEEWEYSHLKHIRRTIGQYFRPQRMRFNFAMRMGTVLAISLLLAEILGFYKIIWAVIPIMSITQPYVEDTHKRKIDRLESNIIAAVVITIVLNVVKLEWFIIGILIVSFYLYYAYKDYYHISLFLTIISMCISTVNAGINTLFFYRIIYVVIGVIVVGITSKLAPYRIEDGIKELIKEIQYVNQVLERENELIEQGEGDLNVIRENVIYSAVLCQKLYVRNKQYQDEKVIELIREHIESTIRLSYKVLRNRAR
ncbi:MAG: FUSC family protein [Cellulosilyticum sp.]|nr:FUSC family protein [Cellulosilyticum sp.]